MAKKIKTKKAEKEKKKIVFDETLPQNILPVGDRVEEDKNIYISQAVYKEIHEFTRNKTKNESGGMLVGNVIEEFGKTNIVIHGFVEAKHCDATPTTLKFTHDTWDYVHEVIDKNYEKGQIVGWIHTHPDYGIFLSEYDKFIQENFFKEEYQIAYVVDPIQNIEGFYFWINGKIEKCKGFYIFDKTGEKIDIEDVKNASADEKADTLTAAHGISSPGAVYMLVAALVVVILAAVIVCTNVLNRMKILETEQENLTQQTAQNEAALQQQILMLNSVINELQGEVNTLKAQQEEAAVVEETTVEEETVEENADEENTETEAEEITEKSTEEEENKSGEGE